MTGGLMERGPIAWMAKNPVAANIALVILLFGGVINVFRVTQEIFPEFELDIISVGVPYPGASPEEIEQGVLLALEESIRGIDGVKRVTSTANEGLGSLMVELELGADSDKALNDVQNGIDQIRTFPEGSERPTSQILVGRQEVIALVIHGNVNEHVLRHYADIARDDLLDKPGITLVELSGHRPREISVEVPKNRLRAHGLTLQDVANQISRSSVEIPAGEIRTVTGDIALRTDERLDFANQYEDLVIGSSPSGGRIRLGDIAKVTDTFADTNVFALFDGEPAIMVRVFRTGKQTPVSIAHTAKEYLTDLRAKLPPGVGVGIWNDFSELFEQRVNLLLRNAFIGLILVFFVIGLFLEARLAFWVTMGIPASFLGSFLLIPTMDVTINMISLFAFIVTLGMVVDDAIVVGENIYEHRKRHESNLASSIRGAREIAKPIIFAILTTMVAFTPMFFVPGVMGKLFKVIPTIVVAVLAISLVESLLVLPSHLAHTKVLPERKGIRLRIHQMQQRFSERFMDFVNVRYSPLVIKAVKFRYVTLGVSLALLFVSWGFVAGGLIDFSFMPNIDSDLVSVVARLPVGTQVGKTVELQNRLVAGAKKTLDDFGGQHFSKGLFSQIGQAMYRGGPPTPGSGGTGSHNLDMMISLVEPGQKPFSGEEFASAWRKNMGEVPGVKSLIFEAKLGPSAGSPIDVQLRHQNTVVLEHAARDLAATLKTYVGVTAVDDGVSEGKPQLDFKIKPEGLRLGLSAGQIGADVRNAFYGAEALRRQRNRDEVKVMVRLPESERRSLYDIENYRVRSPLGGEVPFGSVAEINRGQSYSFIRREEGSRIVSVKADVIPGVTTGGKIMTELFEKDIEELKQKFSGLKVTVSGEQREQAETMADLGLGFIIALLVMYALLAIPFKSYIQPLIVMSVIPFGFVGALIGHVLMGYNISIVSMMGLVALSGIVVNDTLVLIHAANERRDQGASSAEAVAQAGVRRFRPILLTSVTTFLGLAPMIFETSLQARFLIPMAISLGFGVLFATVLTLILAPALYVMVDDVKGIFTARAKAR